MCILPLEIHVPALDIVVECFLYMTLIFTEMNTSLEVVLSPVYRWETRLGEVKQLAYGHMTSKSGAQRFTRQPQCTPVSHTVWSLSKRSYPTNRIFSEEALFVLASVLAGLGYFVLMLESHFYAEHTETICFFSFKKILDKIHQNWNAFSIFKINEVRPGKRHICCLRNWLNKMEKNNSWVVFVDHF